MLDVKKVRAAELFPFISEIIKQGQSARILVSGSSMYPFLRDGIDSVELNRASFGGLKRGDIVMIRRADGTYVMHRILRIRRDCLYIVGDAQKWIEGPVQPDQLVAVVTSIWRKDQQISCSNIAWKLLSQAWLILLPVRDLILRIYNKISGLRKHLSHLLHNN